MPKEAASRHDASTRRASRSSPPTAATRTVFQPGTNAVITSASDAPPPVAYEARGLIRDIPLSPHDLVDARTPVDRLFMLVHLGVVRMRREDWRLDLGGLVERPLHLRFADLDGFPSARIEAVHQCAGNPLDPTVATRRVACVVWEGVWLADLLAAARPRDNATYVWTDGADVGPFAGEHVPWFRKDLPLARVAADVLLATRLNGARLPGRHGGPVRLVVPGFYGTNSVKWIWRMTLADRRADGLFTTRYYNDALPDGSTRPVYGLAPESVVVSPAPHTRIGRQTDLCGWAWGDVPVASVEVSIDDGATWAAASVTERAGREWQAWRMRAGFPRSGPAHVMCRATDALGRTQPSTGARNEIHRVEVTSEA